MFLLFCFDQAIEPTIPLPPNTLLGSDIQSTLRLLKSRPTDPAPTQDELNHAFLALMAYEPTPDVLRCAHLLLTQGANINTRDFSQRTAVHLASQAGHLKMLQFLKRHGADFTAVDARGWNAIAYASRHPNHKRIISFLIYDSSLSRIKRMIRIISIVGLTTTFMALLILARRYS